MIHCVTVGELVDALAALPGDTKLHVEYDGGSGEACSVGVAADYLTIDYDPRQCENGALR